MSDEQLLRLLKLIYEMAILPYPYPAGSAVDPDLVSALGDIASLAQIAIDQAQQLNLPAASPAAG